MLEIVAEKFKRLGCTFLEKVEVSSNKAWIDGIFFLNRFLFYTFFISRSLAPTQSRKEKVDDLVPENSRRFF